LPHLGRCSLLVFNGKNSTTADKSNANNARIQQNKGLYFPNHHTQDKICKPNALLDLV
uniref:Uncharacterized protein n=1 Tax=Aegilops tauschii subsp. strangulata TaxID=200361 RepID=A0A453HNJ6_AEGTS